MSLVGRSKKYGAGIVIVFFCSAILVFAARSSGCVQACDWSAIAEFCLIIPLVILVISASDLNRPIIYFIQNELMLAWLVLDLILRYVLKVDSSRIGWAEAGYMILFFAGGIGMLCICFRDGKRWGVPSLILFIALSVLVFLQQVDPLR